MSDEQDKRLERFWKQSDGVPTAEDYKERGRAYEKWAEQSGMFGPSLLEAIKKLVRGET